MASEGATTGQPHLHKQDLSKLDISKLTALSPEVISRQATINIGTIGHVAHGKSTVVKAISGVQTVRFKNELERNITIKLGDEVGSLEELPHSTCSVEGGEQNICKQESSVAALEKAPHSKKKRPISREYRTKKLHQTKKKKKLPQRLVAPGAQPDGNWEVEQILDIDFMFGERKFLVKWKGWGSEFNSWEPLRNVYNCQELIMDYFRKNKSAALEAELKGEPSEEALKSKAEEIVKVDSETLETFMESVRVDGKLVFYAPSKEEVNNKVKKLLKEENSPDIIAEAKTAILAHKLGLLRKQQQLLLADWQNEMNLLAPNEAPISVENTFDLEAAPQNFTYIAGYIPGPRVSLPEDPPIGCSCKPCGPKSFCCNAQNDAVFAYNKQGKLIVAQGSPVYECNRKCACNNDCTNKVVQKGRQVKLAIYRTSNGCGWGVKAKQTIKKGTFVCEYVGEVITSEEAEMRGEQYDADGRTYLFDLDFNDPDNCLYTVDAAMYGNISHFINHSCDPNCGVFAVWVNCLDPNIPSLCLFALRDIESEEQITFNYSSSQSRLSKSMCQPNLEFKTQCKCKSDMCRKYLF